MLTLKDSGRAFWPFKVLSCVELYYLDVFWDAVALRDDAVVSQNSSIVQFDITPTQPRTQLQNG